MTSNVLRFVRAAMILLGETARDVLAILGTMALVVVMIALVATVLAAHAASTILQGSVPWYVPDREFFLCAAEITEPIEMAAFFAPPIGLAAVLLFLGSLVARRISRRQRLLAMVVIGCWAFSTLWLGYALSQTEERIGFPTSYWLQELRR